MTITAKCQPGYLITVNAVAKYLQFGLAIVISYFASSPLCYEHYFTNGQKICLSVFDSRSDVHGQAFVVVASAIMAVEIYVVFLARLLDVRNMHYETNWRTVELFFNGVGFSVFVLFGALETWYALGYFEGLDYISTLNVRTAWTVAAACSFANAILHVLTMTCVGISSSKQ